MEKNNFVVNITVKDFIIPKNNTDPFHVVVSFVDEKNNYGEVRVERINPLSWFYEIEYIEIYHINSIEKCKEMHEKLCEKYRKRRDKIEESEKKKEGNNEN